MDSHFSILQRNWIIHIHHDLCQSQFESMNRHCPAITDANGYPRDYELS